MKRQVILAVVITALGLSGCQEKGPMEKAGEQVDKIVDSVERGDQPFKETGIIRGEDW